jgi:uroporphyrinogen III methyltransferase/synthase
LSTRGRVILVGAGPGDPGLLTLRGAEALRAADAVVFDALSPPEVLAMARSDAARINVGKRGHDAPTLAQEEISKLLVDLAREGKTVVRLKGGDPFVFGRGGEEASACAAAGVAFEIVPGVSAAVAAAAYAGIPVTDRRHAASFAVVTGHKDPATSATQVRWAELARGADTLVILMGLRSIEGIVAELVAHGRAPDAPAAVIADATTPRQRVLTATLSQLATRVREAGITAPATIIVGEVVALRESLAWYERLPLFGRRVVVTRAEAQAGEMLAALRAAGAEPIALPLLRIVPCEDTNALDEALVHASRYDAILFTSANAVRIFASQATRLGIDVAGEKFVAACVGPATATAARQAGLTVRVVPCDRFDADGLLEALQATLSIAGQRFLLPRSAVARGRLPEGLRAAGAQVDVIDLYRPEPAPLDEAWLREELAADHLHVLTFTSPSTVRHFLAHLDAGALAGAGRAVVAALGPVTAAALRENGLPPQVVASRAGGDALVEALIAHFAVSTAAPAGERA